MMPELPTGRRPGCLDRLSIFIVILINYCPAEN